MNFFQGIPSPAGGCLILFPIMYELSSFSFLFQIKNLSPFLVILASILLISKVPTFSFKKIVVQRKMTLFLLLGFGLFFVSIIQFTYETMAICCLLYLILIPVSIFNYRSKLRTVQKEIAEEDQRDIL
jgi:Phosphatidylserine synthase